MTATIIREATLQDEPRLLALLVELALVSPYVRHAPDVEHLTVMLGRLLPNADALFLVAERAGEMVGLLVLLLSRDLVSGEALASQVCWYVNPTCRDGLGLQLLAAGEAWADHRQATVQMIGPVQKFGSAYRRRGYVPAGCIFERRLN